MGSPVGHAQGGGQDRLHRREDERVQGTASDYAGDGGKVPWTHREGLGRVLLRSEAHAELCGGCISLLKCSLEALPNNIVSTHILTCLHALMNALTFVQWILISALTEIDA